MNTFTIIGLTGLVIQLAINGTAWLVLKKPEAEFFAGDWWTYWFPAYVVWGVFLTVGLAQAGKKKPAR